MKQAKIWTIGHSVHGLQDFVTLLQEKDCLLVADVRAVPYSRHCPQFQKENVAKALSQNGLDYRFFGDKLGGRSADPSYYNERGQIQYPLIAKSPLFQTGLNEILQMAEKQSLALMCAEKEPLQCHRTILISRELLRLKNFPKDRLQHILFDGSLKTQEEIEQSLLEKFKLFPDLFRSPEECLEEAYNRQDKKIAYCLQASQKADLAGIS